MQESLNHIKQQLLLFESTGLSRLDKMQLLDRQDSKAFFHISAVPELLETVQPHYSVLEIDKKRIFHYQTLYFDTPDLALYQAHHNGRLARHKLRYRKYVDSDVTFFEIKTKTNKGRNIKERIRVKDISKELCSDCIKLIETHSDLDARKMQPTLSAFVQRITFVSKDFMEKATLDINIEFTLNGSAMDTDGLVIAEVKQYHYTAQSQFLKALHLYKIYPNNISKYCLGLLNLKENIKYNRFKPRLLKLNKVTNNTFKKL